MNEFFSQRQRYFFSKTYLIISYPMPNINYQCIQEKISYQQILFILYKGLIAQIIKNIKNFQNFIHIQTITTIMTEAVKVMVRCRPMSTKEKERGCTSVITMDHSVNQVKISKPGSQQPPKAFSFDCVFGVDSLQSVVYEQTAFALVDNVLQGYNGTIFAYGQTGCGKTHTMMGSSETQQSKGIIPRTFHQIITLTNAQKDKKHLVQCSFIQIYNEQIHDLLGKDIKSRMELKESPDKGVFVKDLSYNIVKTESEMQKYMEMGFKNRAVRETAMNKESSRSHSIFTIHIESQESDQLGNQKFKVGKLNLVDLAGSERQSKTGATGDGMKEAAKINLSLSALGNVISALVDGKTQHIPYRDSKLTRLLQDSLGGNTKTIMIAALSPADYNYDQSLSTLRYASRAKFIQNKPVVNEDPKDTLLRQYAQQIKKLKMMLQGKAPLTASQLHFGDDGKPQIIYKEVIVQRQRQGSHSGSSFPPGGNSVQLQNQLRSKQDQLKNQQLQKQKLKEQMEKLQKLISHEDTTVDKKEIEKMNKLKEKLKQQKKKEEDYINEKKKREEELLNLQSNYKSLNEEVEAMRAKFSKIKAKYIENANQIRDIQTQHQRQKEQLLDTIRSQQAEINKFSSILKMLLTNDQIQLIVQQSWFNDETREWNIAPFYYRQKNINFPKLPANQTRELINNEKEKKEIVFKDFNQNSFRRNQSGLNFNQYNNNSRNEVKEERQSLGGGSNNAIAKSKESFKISQVLKGARQNKQYKRQKQKSQYGNKPPIDLERYEKFDNKSSHNHLTSLNRIVQPNPTPKMHKNPQLTPLKVQSQQRIRLDEMNLNGGLYEKNNNSNHGNSSKNVKLNPLNNKKDMSSNYG